MKQKTIKGTKPTLIQRKILEKNKLNPSEWMFVKEVKENKDNVYRSENRKSLGRNVDKVTYLQFINRTSGEVKSIQM